MSHVCDGRDPSCASCVAMARRLGAVRAAMVFDEQLDDIKRARIWTQLEDKLADSAAPRRRWPIALGVAAAAAVVAVAVTAVQPPRDDEPSVLAVPVDTTVSSRLGPYASTSIVGPARLEMLGPPGDATAVRLRSGTLFAEFSGGAGRSLRIEAPGAVIDVVGTLFAVQVRDGQTCTSVAHGRVRVTTRLGEVYVTGGQAHCTGDSVQPISSEMRETIAKHARTLVTEAKAVAEPVEVVDPEAEEQVAPAAVATAAVAPAAPLAVAPPAAVLAPKPELTTKPSPAAKPTARSMPAAPAAIANPAPPSPPELAVPAKLTADELYRTAEAALAARNLSAADDALSVLLAEYPSSPLVDQALYERARIAHRQRAWSAARTYLDRLALIPGTPLAESGHYLRCRIAVEARDRAATACLTDYRAAFPRSPHDLEVLALLTQLAHAAGGCGQATELVDELGLRYPRATLATAWRARCPVPQPGPRPGPP